ncbi:MAG: hypothetical protein UY58_C0005G0015 [Candidatus Magasanikbacteria bacterium GW2011_GWA2_50_22]|uniref:Uncharacterized protein n=1 Tax=Candidatus Magasanikbacteria bacterium GW2011_GWA2_50_22 TaxID=1619043 RepID=A0A0G1YQQ5_9BACT|nr:MAG: hypothetical protein UY58_C0005G0015 [Candidatus Magasanikbacteria bacterium GW2011_GWA2_50_22]
MHGVRGDHAREAVGAARDRDEANFLFVIIAPDNLKYLFRYFVRGGNMDFVRNTKVFQAFNDFIGPVLVLGGGDDYRFLKCSSRTWSCWSPFVFSSFIFL